MSAAQAFQPAYNLAPRRQSNLDAPELIEAARDVLNQGLTLLFGLKDDSYSRMASAPFQASIGQHYRHVLEHFQCLIKGVRLREVNYDARERRPRLENEVTHASVVTCEILRALKSWTDETLEQDCGVISTVGYTTSRALSLESNVARELADCVGHAIHHYAILRLICSEIGITVPPEFGYAPSTLKHMSSMAAD